MLNIQNKNGATGSGRAHAAASGSQARSLHVRSSVFGLIGVLLVLLLSGPALAEQRIALVIGNGKYNLSPLANPANDARLMSRALRHAGFAVTMLLDANHATMNTAILKFGRALRNSDSVGLFYYAGHGVQIDGENYLIPVASEIADTSEVALAGINLNQLLRTMQRASSRLNIAILDACRDNPYPAPARSAIRGLAQVRAPSGTIIAYATGPGEVALDGTGANSPYTRALASAIPIDGIPLEEVFRRTRRQVLKSTAGRQTPWEHSSLTGEFFFHPKRAVPEPSDRISDGTTAADRLRLSELDDWQKIRNSTDRSVFAQHLRRYPDGVFAELAAIKRDALARQSNSPWSWITTGTVEKTTVLTEAEAEFERAVQLASAANPKTGSVEATRLYRRAADKGLPSAMYALGRSYDRGLGIGRNLSEAAAWYKRAADHRHPAAMAALGTMYEYGEAVPSDLAEALRLYRLAADAGDPHAMASLGYLYAAGKGVARDPKRARTWYKKAAKRGLPRAMYNLALMYVRGKAGRGKLADAVSLLERATTKGHAKSMRQLAYLHDEGEGVARSPVRAAELVLRAIEFEGNEAVGIPKPGAWSLATRREIQRQLKRRGLYNGPAHGAINLATRSALQKLASARDH